MQTKSGSYTVGQVADLAGVTVRALHHYDEIGLLSPSDRTPAGYRQYAGEDLERLAQILSYRELGFPLEEIATLLDDPHADAAAHLRRQHRMLTGRVARLQEMVAAVERAMEAEKMGITLTPEERFELFGDFLPEDYAEEAQARWGESEAWEQSQRRTSSYTKEDWVQIKAEGAGIEHGLASALAAGVPAGGVQAMDLAEAHRQHLTRWFYDAGHDLHRGLGEMYVSDPRFTAYYDAIAPGLATYVRDAIAANADRAAAG